MNNKEAEKKIMIKNYLIEMSPHANVRSVALCDQKIVVLDTKNTLNVFSYDIKLIEHIPLTEPCFQGKGFILGEEDKKALVFVDTENYKEILIYNLKTLQIVKRITTDHIHDIRLSDSLLYVLARDNLKIFAVSNTRQGNLIGVLEFLNVHIDKPILSNKDLKLSDRQNWLIETEQLMYLAIIYKKVQSKSYFKILCLSKSSPHKGIKDEFQFNTKHQTKQFLMLPRRNSAETNRIISFLNENNKVIFINPVNGKEIPYLIEKLNSYTPIYMNFVEKGRYLQLVQAQEIVTLDLSYNLKQVASRMKEIADTDWVFRREILYFQKNKLILAQKDSLNIMWYE